MQSKSRGFTLIELMVVVALAAIFLGIGVPSFKNFVAGQRVKTAAGDFAMAVVFARAEAIKRNMDVTMTAATSGASGWKDGWTVAAGGNSLSVQPAFEGVTFAGPASGITYKRSGRLSAAVGSMTITGQDGNARCVTIDLSGMPNITKGACL